MSDGEIDRDDEAARMDGNYMARRYIAEVRQWRAIAERDHGKPITQALTAEEREALVWAIKHINATTMPGVRPRADKAAALAILSRLTDGRES